MQPKVCASGLWQQVRVRSAACAAGSGAVRDVSARRRREEAKTAGARQWQCAARVYKVVARAAGGSGGAQRHARGARRGSAATKAKGRRCVRRAGARQGRCVGGTAARSSGCAAVVGGVNVRVHAQSTIPMRRRSGTCRWGLGTPGFCLVSNAARLTGLVPSACAG